MTPNDPLDDLIAAALHGELSPEEQSQFEARLQSDPSARTAYEKALQMHQRLEGHFEKAQPDASFEQRMVARVFRELPLSTRPLSPGQRFVQFWKDVTRIPLTQYAVMLALASIIAFSVLIAMGNQVKGVFTTISSQLAYAGSSH